jgi:hypothetical protein
MNPSPISFAKKPPAPIVRPGIKPDAIAAAGIRRVNATEAAHHGLGGHGSGILIPYHDLGVKPIQRESDGPHTFARLRLNSSDDGKKYAQGKDTQACAYLPPGLAALLQSITLSTKAMPQALYLTEGEFKALAAVLAGIIAVGVGGISSAVVGGQLVHLLRDFIPDWGFERVVLVGDSDVGINYDFARAAVALAKAVPEDVDVFVIAPGLDAPAKGLDDQIEKLGDKFAAYWAGLVADAVAVPRGMSADEVALQLLRKENPATLRAIYRGETTEAAA